MKANAVDNNYEFTFAFMVSNDYCVFLKNIPEDEKNSMFSVQYYSPQLDNIGTLSTTKFLCYEKGIKPRPRLDKYVGTGAKCTIGFSERDQKWYGWSHKLICGFGVGSKVKRGDFAYIANTPEKLIDDYVNLFKGISNESANLRYAECQILPDRSGIFILHSTLEGVHENAVTIKQCGRGEWTAKTLDDAKEMAQTFALVVH